MWWLIDERNGEAANAGDVFLAPAKKKQANESDRQLEKSIYQRNLCVAMAAGSTAANCQFNYLLSKAMPTPDPTAIPGFVNTVREENSPCCRVCI